MRQRNTSLSYESGLVGGIKLFPFENVAVHK